MCGIFAYKGIKINAGDLILAGLKSLEYRGYDSWGIAIKNNNNHIYLEKHIGKIGQARLPKIKASIGFGHTRWATHGQVTEVNAHPHSDCKNQIMVVHNGIFENFEKIKQKLLANGHQFKSETDTEVIAHLIEEKESNYNDRKKLIIDVFRQIKGLNAMIIFYPKEEEFYAIKNGSPIVFGKNNKEFVIASDASAIVPYTKKAYFLEDNELLVISGNQAKLYNLNIKLKKINFLKLTFNQQDVRLGKFPHYMIKEINEQPKILENIVNNQKEIIKKATQIIKKSYGTYFIGCGTAFYAALAGTYLFSKIAKRHINAAIGSEFTYLKDFLKNTSLVIALSQSGETIDIISSIRTAKEKQAKTMAITNVLGSTLYRISDYKILLNAGPEKCVLATKSFTAKIALLYLMASLLNTEIEKKLLSIKKAIKEVKKLIASSKIKKIANYLKDKKHIYIIGRGISYPAALESALKIKEASYIHAEAFAGGELKHGPIALIEKGTPVIIYHPEDETYKDTLSSAYEVKARGAEVIGISNKPSSVYNQFIPVADCQEATIIPNVVVAQLLSYYITIAKGLDPDKPRNLAKSVTVK